MAAPVPPRPGQASTPWTRDSWAPLQALSDSQLAEFNKLVDRHRLLTSNWIYHDQFFNRHRKFFQDVIHKVKSIDIQYAYCIGLGSLLGHEPFEPRNETPEMKETREKRTSEERIYQLIIFQTWMDLLNNSPICPNGIPQKNVYVQELDYTKHGKEVDKLFLESLGYQTKEYPELEKIIRITAPNTFLYAPNVSFTSVAALHGNAFAFPWGGIPFFLQNNIVADHGRWERMLERTVSEQQKGTWIYKKIANEYVCRSVISFTRPIEWEPIPEALEFLEKIWCYWRLDKDYDFQVINLDLYSKEEDDVYHSEDELDPGEMYSDDSKYWLKNPLKGRCLRVIGTSKFGPPDPISANATRP